ncbi:hypothetical protein D3C86_1688900 [compost metagenome]
MRSHEPLTVKLDFMFRAASALAIPTIVATNPRPSFSTPQAPLGPEALQAKNHGPRRIFPLRRRGVLTQDLDSQSVIHTTSGVIHSTTGHSDGRRRSVADDGIHGAFFGSGRR